MRWRRFSAGAWVLADELHEPTVGVRARRIEHPAVDRDRPRGGIGEAGDDPGDGRLTRARLADQGHDLAGFDRERHVVDRDDGRGRLPPVPRRDVLLGEVLHREHAHAAVASATSAGVRVPGLGEQLVDRGDFDQLAVEEHADTVAHVRDHREVVRHVEHRQGELAPDVEQQLEHLRLHRRVEGGGRLVGEQERGPVREGGDGEHESLQLPARELRRQVVGAFDHRLESHGRQRRR